jgi:hypothetical protein
MSPRLIIVSNRVVTPEEADSSLGRDGESCAQKSERHVVWLERQDDRPAGE